jgi:hypothetical protein
VKYVGFFYRVQAEVLLTKEDVGRLTFYSGRHYDSKCRLASELGGFIYGWKNHAEYAEEIPVSATFDQVDLVCKILEADPLSEISVFFRSLLRDMQAESERLNADG